MALPTEKTPARKGLDGLSVLIVAASKYGKTTMASQWPDVLFLATEPGLGALEAYQQPVRSWVELCTALGELKAGGHPFKSVCLDTVDNAYRFCSEYVLKQQKLEHESDAAFGKGFTMVAREFARVLTGMGHLGLSLVITSHVQAVEIETRTGKYTRMVPSMPARIREIVLGLVDVIAYGDHEYEKGKAPRRVLRLRPCAEYEAGSRIRGLPATVEPTYQALSAALEQARAAMTPPVTQNESENAKP